MRKLTRPSLSEPAQAFLIDCTTHVIGSASLADRTAEARARWKKAKKTPHFKEVRRQLSEMASGRSRCMYCEDNQGTDIDHFEPVALAPEKAYEWENYFLACSYCNSNLKRDAFPVDAAGKAQLVNPCNDDPSEHMALMIQSSYFGALSEMGLRTVEVFGLNSRQPLVDGRMGALVTAKSLIPQYAKLRKENAAASDLIADWILDTLRASQFSVVLVTLVDLFKNRSPALDADLVNAFHGHPELLTLT